MKDLQNLTVNEIIARDDLLGLSNNELFDRGVTAMVLMGLNSAGFFKPAQPDKASDEPKSNDKANDADNCNYNDELGQQLVIKSLLPYPNHWFKPISEEHMKSLCASISMVGILQPVIARPIAEGYQIIAGHNRVEAARRLGRRSVPTHVKHLNDDEAIIVMADTNLESRELLPSEKAWSYRFKLEAKKRCASRAIGVRDQLGHETESNRSIDLIAEDSKDSRNQIQRYIRLTELITELLDLVDAQKLAFVTAVALSYLSAQDQELVLEVIKQLKRFPSEEQAKQLRTIADRGQLDQSNIEKVILGIYNPRKVSSRRPKILRIETKQILSIFKESTTPQQAQDKAIEAINNYQWLEEHAAEQLRQLLSVKE